MRVVVAAEYYPRRADPVLGVWAHRQARAARDAGAVGRACDEHRPEVIFHLAAQVDVRRSVADPPHDARVNVEGTLVMLEAARRHGARLVFSSTGGAIYGETDVVPTPEDAARRPLAPYGQGKAAAEDYLALYARLHGADVVALRYANVYGPRQDPLGEGGVVAIFAERAHRDETAIVWTRQSGTDELAETEIPF